MICENHITNYYSAFNKTVSIVQHLYRFVQFFLDFY
jgi:hypothetical protein